MHTHKLYIHKRKYATVLSSVILDHSPQNVVSVQIFILDSKSIEEQVKIITKLNIDIQYKKSKIYIKKYQQ